MRRAVHPVIPPNMYRHFAIVTLALTAGLAMFAEGEGREARTARAAVTQPAPAPSATFASPAEAEEWAPGGWEDDSGDGGGFGGAAGSAFGGIDSSILPDFDEIAVPGYPAEYLASLSEEERALLLQGLQDNGMLSAEVRRRRSAALRAAYGRRSGVPAGEW